MTGRGRGYNSQFNENTARSRAGYPGIGGQYLRIRTLLVGGADWLARRRRCSPAGVSGAGSATHRGSGMYLEDFGHKGPDAPRRRWRSRRWKSRSVGQYLRAGRPSRGDADGEPAANSLRHGCARLAERIRESAGVTTGDATSAQRAATGTPWLGLLLWFFACAALFVSLIMRPDDLDRDHLVAARGRPSRPSRTMHSRCQALTEHASEVRLIVSPRLPSRWAAD